VSPAIQAVASVRPRSVTHAFAFAPQAEAIPKDHLLFGSHIPFWTIEKSATAMNKFHISTADRRKIQREHALPLVPAFQVVS
jgi:predicted TIM-barrel fold metal-dependent hydrolase